MIKEYTPYIVKGLLPGERVIHGVDRLVHHMPWLSATEMAKILGCRPDSIRSIVWRSGDTLNELKKDRIKELLALEQSLE